MSQCTQYMHKRYKLKLQVQSLSVLAVDEIPWFCFQVSKCEKFGYGCMVTQLASTVAGMLELHNCGTSRPRDDTIFIFEAYPKLKYYFGNLFAVILAAFKGAYSLLLPSVLDGNVLPLNLPLWSIIP